MNQHKRDIEALFIDAVEGTLSTEQQNALDEAFAQDPELRNSFLQYQKICHVERNLAASVHEAPVGLSTRIMAQVEEEPFGFMRRLYMRLNLTPQQVMRGVAACAVVALCIAVVWDEDGSIRKNTPLLTPSVPDARPPSGIVVPEPVRQEGASEPKTDLKDETRTVGKNEGKSKSSDLLANVGPHAPKELELADRGSVANVQPGPSSVVVPQANVQSKQAGAPLPQINYDSARRVDGQDPQRTAEILNKTTKRMSEGDSLDQSAAIVNQQLIGSASSHQFAGILRDRASGITPLPPPASLNRENYQNYGERQVIATEVEPVSTFSIDVDTGSYTNVRRMLRSGQLPPPDAVRIEEFLNYFSYNYPLQTEKPFTLSYEIAPAPLEEGKLLLKLGIRARDVLEVRKPWNLVFLIDVSGSMQPQNRLPLVKSALKILVDQMKPGDRVGIVTYAGYSGVALEPTDISQKGRILDIIDRLGAGGSTAGAAGIQQAYDLARRHYSQGAVNRVILATDGDFNVGISDRSSLIRLIETQRQSGVTLTTVGVGEGNLQEATMEQLANKGNGNFFYLDSFEEAHKVFQRDVAGTVEVVAKDVKLQMEFNPMQVSHYRLVGYENRALANHEFHDDRIDAGEIGTGHTVTALYEVVLRQSPLAKQLSSERRYGQESTTKVLSDSHQGELGFLRIRFKEPEAQSSSLLEFPVQRQSVVGRWQDASDDFRFAAAVSYFGHLLRQSQFRGAYGFEQVKALASAAFGQDSEGQRREFVQLVELARTAAEIQRGFLGQGVPGLEMTPTPWPAAPGLQ